MALPTHNVRTTLAQVTVVVLCAPFLVFPTFAPGITAGALCLLTLWWASSLFWRPLSPSVTALHGPIFIWLTMVAVGTLLSAFPTTTLPKTTNLLLGAAIWHAMATLSPSRITIRWSVIATALAGLAMVALGVLTTNFANKIPGLAPALALLPTHTAGLPEAPQQGVNPNQLAGTLTILFPWALSELAHRVTHGWNLSRGRGSLTAHIGSTVLVMASVVILGTLLVLSQSRSAWIGTLTGIIALVALWGLTAASRRLRAITMAAVLMCITAVLVAGLTIGAHRLETWWDSAVLTGVETTFAGSISLSGRIEIWRGALSVIQDFPFTGCGLGSFRYVVWPRYPLYGIAQGSDIAHAHNIFLQVALDTGLPGLVAYLAILLCSGTMAWQVACRSRTYRSMSLGLLSGLVALHVYGLTDTLAPGSKTALLFWTALGLLTLLSRTLPKPADDAPAAF